MADTILWEIPQKVVAEGKAILSSGTPNIAQLGAQIILAWRGENDEYIWLSATGIHQIKNVQWTVPELSKGSDGKEFKMTQGSAPCITPTNDKLIMTWNDAITNNDTLYYAAYSAYRTVNTWTNSVKSPLKSNAQGGGSSTILLNGSITFVATAVNKFFNDKGNIEGRLIDFKILSANQVMATWSGGLWENPYYKEYDEKLFEQFKTTYSPSVVAISATAVFLVWCAGTDIKYAIYDIIKQSWYNINAPVGEVAGYNGLKFRCICQAPDILFRDEKIMMVWTNDGKMFTANYDLKTGKWTDKLQITAGTATDTKNFDSTTPVTIINVDDNVFMVWKKSGTKELWYSSRKL